MTGAEIKDAQMKIQTRFQSVNDLLRSGATTYTSTDEDNAHQFASVAGGPCGSPDPRHSPTLPDHLSRKGKDMSGDGTMIYNPMGLADLTSSMVQFSQELDQIGQEAHTLLAGSQEFFQGPSGAVNYQQAQQLINEGIQDGKDVIARHGSTVDTASANFSSADLQVGNSFGGV